MKLQAPGSAGYGMLIVGVALLVCALGLFGNGVPWLTALVGLPALLLFYAGLALVFNLLAISVDDDYITVRPVGLPFPRSKTVRVPTAGVTQVYIEHARASETAKPYFHLMVQYANLRSEPLIKNYEDLEQLRSAERALDRALKPDTGASGLDLGAPRQAGARVKEFLRVGRDKPK